MSDNKKPLIFLKPYVPALKTLLETVNGIAEAEGYDIYEVSSPEELNQTFGSLGPSLTLMCHTEKCGQFLKANRKTITQQKSKVVLITQASVSPIELEKLQKMGLTEAMHEPIHQKTLLYKVKMLVKALPQMKTGDGNANDEKVFSKTKEESTLNSMEKMRLEKGIVGEESDELNSEGGRDALDLEIEMEGDERGDTDLDIESSPKKSKIGSILKSLGTFGKKKTKGDLDIDEEQDSNGKRFDLNLEGNELKKKKASSFNIDEELKKKRHALGLEKGAQASEDPLEIKIEDIELMRKRGIRLDILPNTPRDKLELILKQDPVLRKKILNFKIAEMAKKKKISVQEMKLELEGSKKSDKDKADTRAKLLEERRKLLTQKLSEEIESEESEEEELTNKKEPEPERIYEPQSKNMEKLIEVLSLYQDKKVDHQDILKKVASTLYEMRGALVGYLSYNEEKKILDDIYFSHGEEYNKERSTRGEEYWRTIKSERTPKWIGTKLSTWSDEWFTGADKDIEFIYPIIEGRSLIGLIVLQILLKEGERFTEQDSRLVEVFIESSRGVYLAKFKAGNERAEDDSSLAGDGTSYAKIFKDFFAKVFKKVKEDE